MNPAPADLLIVEDQAPMRLALRDYLRTAHPAAEIVEAFDAAGALKQCRERHPRVVLTDLGIPDPGMPGLNGIELILRIKSVHPACIVIVVSQQSARVYADMALAAGAVAYVCKDRIFHELLAPVAAALAEPS